MIPLAAPKTTTWPLEPHTAAKHVILRRYLDAWLPILSQGGFPKILYIDAFAGPGIYAHGELGSQVIAIKAMMDHKFPISAKCRFDFVELDAERARSLQVEINKLFENSNRPANLEINIHQERFDVAYRAIKIDSFYAQKIPTFAFIDPFGWTGLPFSIVEDLLQRPSCEVFINFMFEEINRFLDHPDQISNFDQLFGTKDWRECIKLSGSERNRAIRDLYAQQLARRAKYVRYFEMKNRKNSTDYYLFFATNQMPGLKKMKEAMWSVDKAGDFQFSDATNPDQMVLFESEPNYSVLEKQILEKFSGRISSIEEITSFVLTDTAFRETHIKRQILSPLEKAIPPKLTVVRPKVGRKLGTFPDGTLIKFL